eukprot:g2755.t1
MQRNSTLNGVSNNDVDSDSDASFIDEIESELIEKQEVISHPSKPLRQQGHISLTSHISSPKRKAESQEIDIIPSLPNNVMGYGTSHPKNAMNSLLSSSYPPANPSSRLAIKKVSRNNHEHSSPRTTGLSTGLTPKLLALGGLGDILPLDLGKSKAKAKELENEHRHQSLLRERGHSVGSTVTTASSVSTVGSYGIQSSGTGTTMFRRSRSNSLREDSNFTNEEVEALEETSSFSLLKVLELEASRNSVKRAIEHALTITNSSSCRNSPSSTSSVTEQRAPKSILLSFQTVNTERKSEEARAKPLSTVSVTHDVELVRKIASSIEQALNDRYAVSVAYRDQSEEIARCICKNKALRSDILKKSIEASRLVMMDKDQLVNYPENEERKGLSPDESIGEFSDAEDMTNDNDQVTDFATVFDN